MTKRQMVDTIQFALDELGKSREYLGEIPITVEACPMRDPCDGELSATAYTLGRTEGAVHIGRMWLDFAIRTLKECVKEESTALSNPSTPPLDGGPTKKEEV